MLPDFDKHFTIEPVANLPPVLKLSHDDARMYFHHMSELNDSLLVVGGGHPANEPVSYTHLRAHETRGNLVCRLLLEKNFFNDTATTEIYTRKIVGSVRCV